MNVIYYLIPVALIFVIVGVIAFFWATKSEQFDDMEKHGLSILMDEEKEETKDNKMQRNKDNQPNTKN